MSTTTTNKNVSAWHGAYAPTQTHTQAHTVIDAETNTIFDFKCRSFCRLNKLEMYTSSTQSVMYSMAHFLVGRRQVVYFSSFSFLSLWCDTFMWRHQCRSEWTWKMCAPIKCKCMCAMFSLEKRAQWHHQWRNAHVEYQSLSEACTWTKMLNNFKRLSLSYMCAFMKSFFLFSKAREMLKVEAKACMVFNKWKCIPFFNSNCTFARAFNDFYFRCHLTLNQTPMITWNAGARILEK